MGGVNISPNLQKTADRLKPDGRVVNLSKPEEAPISKDDEIKALEAKLEALKSSK